MSKPTPWITFVLPKAFSTLSNETDAIHCSFCRVEPRERSPPSGVCSAIVTALLAAVQLHGPARHPSPHRRINKRASEAFDTSAYNVVTFRVLAGRRDPM